MYKFFVELFKETELAKYATFLSFILSAAIIVVSCLILRLIVKAILTGIAKRVVKKRRHQWNGIFLKNNLFQRLANLTIPIVISTLGEDLPDFGDIIHKGTEIISVIIILLILDSIIKSIDEIYRLYDISKVRPIRSVLQIVRVVVLIIGGISGIAILIGKSPLALIGGLGAMTAVTTLIFKDAILGFVAGIQLTSNDMIRIGDWVEVPNADANGNVVDLSLTTVKIQNFDNSITSIPAYTLVSCPFINWRGMQDSGNRQISRTFYIETSCVKLSTPKDIQYYKSIQLIKDYIENKTREIQIYNARKDVDISSPVNGRRITNIGTFRAYILEYLQQHPKIDKDNTIMVYQLDQSNFGIPMKVVAYTTVTDTVEYNDIMSDVFDHIYSVAKEFGLTIYQQPSSGDIKLLANSENIHM